LDGAPAEAERADGRRGAGSEAQQPAAWGAAPVDDGPAWWDAEAAQSARDTVDEAPAEEPAGGKRSRWGRSKAGKGRKGQPAEAAPSANGSPSGRPAAAPPADVDDWASEVATGQSRGTGRQSGPAERSDTPARPGGSERSGTSGRPAWATDPTSGFESDPSGEFTSESRSRISSARTPASTAGEQERGGAAVPGQRQRARDMVFDDDVAPLELNLDEEPKNPDQRSRRFLRRK
jgi:hypothetical protein